MGTIADKLRAALNSKSAIKKVLEDKGLYPSNEFSTYSGLISELENTSDATATADSILEGETAYTAEGKVTGRASSGSKIVTTDGDGSAYTATVTGVTELKVGMELTIIPHVTSENVTPTLNVNDLGAKNIRQRLSTTTATTVAGQSENWLVANKPITVMYDGTYWIADLVRPDANTFYGTLDINQGGTGADTAKAALTNLGAVGKADIVDNLESESTEAPLSANQGRILNETVEDVKTAFQDGCDTICGGCTTYGATPENNSPADIVKAIKKIHDNRFTEGKLAGNRLLFTKTFNKTGIGYEYWDFGETLNSLPTIMLRLTGASGELCLCSECDFYNGREGTTINKVTTAPVTGVRLRIGTADKTVTGVVYVFEKLPVVY